MTFCPSTRPCSTKPLRNASTKWALSLADRALRNPITGLSAGCAPAASGQSTKPTKTLTKLRRRISRLPRLPTNYLTGSCSEIKSISPCPLWVKSRHLHCTNQCPLYPNSDIDCVFRYVRFGPIADITGQLFDHAVDAQQNRWGDRKAQSLDALEVDHEFEFDRLLHR